MNQQLVYATSHSEQSLSIISFDAALAIQRKWRQYRKLMLAVLKLKEFGNERTIISKFLEVSKTSTFEKCQDIVVSEHFLSSFSSILMNIPTLASITSNDKKLARNPRVVSSAVLISNFPEHAMTFNSQIGNKLFPFIVNLFRSHFCFFSLMSMYYCALDTYDEAITLLRAATALNRNLKKLLQHCDHAFSSHMFSLRPFDILFSCFRHAVLRYVLALEDWKRVDKVRMIQSLQVDLIQCMQLLRNADSDR